MFPLSNGPCKLAPRRPEIHIFPRTCRLPIRQVMWANKPRGQLRSQLFVAAVIFYPSRGDEEENRELGGGIQRLGEEMEQKTILCETSEGLMSGAVAGSARQPLEGTNAALAEHGTSQPLSLQGTWRDTPGHVCGTRLSLHNQNYGSLALDAACLSIWLWAENSERLEVLHLHWGEGGCLGCGEIKLAASGLPSGAPASPVQTRQERRNIPAISGRGESREQWRNMCG